MSIVSTIAVLAAWASKHQPLVNSAVLSGVRQTAQVLFKKQETKRAAESAVRKTVDQLQCDPATKRNIRETLARWIDSELVRIVNDASLGRTIVESELERSFVTTTQQSFSVHGVRTSELLEQFVSNFQDELAAKDPAFLSFLLSARVQERLHALRIGTMIRLDDLKGPAATQSVPVLCGRDIRPADLLNGALFDRKLMLDSVWSDDSECKWSFEKWFSKETVGISRFDATPVFWISGSAGAGKSALLMLLMKRLLERKCALVDHAIWLRPSDLPRCLENINGHEDSVEYVFIDDLYSALSNKSWIEEIQFLYKTFLNIPRLAIITCGPAHELQLFQREFLNDEFQVKAREIPLMNGLDKREFEHWLWSRTKIQSAPKLEAPVLPLMVVFASVKGELQSFASRLRKRIERHGLETEVELLMLLSALGRRRPLTLLFEPKRLQRIIRVFGEEGLIELEFDTNRSANYGRIAHPTVATELIRCWFGCNPLTAAKEWAQADKVAAAHILETLMIQYPGDEEILSIARDFVRSKKQGSEIVLLGLIGGALNEEDSVRLSIDWLKMPPAASFGADFLVLLFVLSEGPPSEEILLLGKERWRTGKKEPNILLALVQRAPTDIEIIQWAKQYVADDDDHAGNILQELIEVSSEDAEILALGVNWVRADKPFSPDVLAALLRNFHDRPEVRSLQLSNSFVDD